MKRRFFSSNVISILLSRKQQVFWGSTIFIFPLANPVRICDNQRRCLPQGRDYQEAEDVLRLK